MSKHDPYKLEVNKEARLLRHQKVFARNGSLRFLLVALDEQLQMLRELIKKYIPQKKKKTLFWSHITAQLNRSVAMTPKTFYKRIGIVAVGLFLLTGFVPQGFEPALVEDTVQSASGTIYLANQEGYFTKTNPQTFDGERIVKDKITHVVEEGENISLIASKYGIKTETLLWENSLSRASTLQIGQKLTIPPVDGVSHTVISGESIDKIAKMYKVDKARIIAQNDIGENEVIHKEQIIFIPGAKPLPKPEPVYRHTSVRSGSYSRLANSTAQPVGAKPFIFPTKGIITQGYHSYHRAFDIADVSKPAVWAAGAGTVERAEYGWNGGYGNVVIINNGNGLKTLYAHLDHINVSVGQSVGQGEVIGRMGNTGRVRGRTGIHLHFEVHKNGIPQVPSNYY